MKCLKCGKELPEGSVFCSNCGTKIEYIKPANVCSNCGTPLPEGSQFCSKCGTKLNVAKVSQPTQRVKNDLASSDKKFIFKIIGAIGIVVAIVLGFLVMSPKPSNQTFEKVMDQMIDDEKFGGLNIIREEQSLYLNDGSTLYMTTYIADDEYSFNAGFFEGDDVEEAKEVYEMLFGELQSGEFGGPDRRFRVENSENRQSISASVDTEEIPYFYGDATKISFKIIRKNKNILILMYSNEVPEMDVNELLRKSGMN